VKPTEGFAAAGTVSYRGLDLPAPVIPADRLRHRYGEGPFARLVMPPLPTTPGVYLWICDGDVVYVGSTETSLRDRLGSRGYATISAYNTLARQPGRTNGGQQTNCRVNALANAALITGRELSICTRTTLREEARAVEAAWMLTFGKPTWNLILGR
jgi:hypothetical protein